MPEDELEIATDSGFPGGMYIVDGKVVDCDGKPIQGWIVDGNGNVAQQLQAKRKEKDRKNGR